VILLLAVIACLCRPADGGPPFLTDDPDPVAFRHWELYAFSTLDKAAEQTEVRAPAFELTYGFAPNFEANLIFPVLASVPEDGSPAYGPGDLELGVKWRFLHETDRSPMAGIAPILSVPTGEEDRGLGNGRAWARLPVWLQKSWGRQGRQWTTYGGGGWAINTAAGQRSYPFGGWLLQKELTERLVLGGELFAWGKTEDGGRAGLIGNFGGYYNFTSSFSLLVTVGHTIAGQRRLVSYVGLFWTW